MAVATQSPYSGDPLEWSLIVRRSSAGRPGRCNLYFLLPCVHGPRVADGFGCLRLNSSRLIQSAVQIPGIEPIRRHDSRHTFETWLVRTDFDVVIVQNLLDIPIITMTARYAHSLSDVKMAAVSKLDLADVCSVPDPNRTPSPTGVVAESDVNSFAAST
jgi:integrase